VFLTDPPTKPLPYTLTPKTLHLRPKLNPTPPGATHPNSGTLDLTPYILDPRSQTLNPNRLTLNPHALNP